MDCKDNRFVDYQDTKIGQIPDGWKFTSLGDIFTFKNGLNKGKEFFGSGNPIVNYMDVFHNPGLYAKDIKGRVTVTKSDIKNHGVLKGDVFFTRTSETINEIGYASVLLEEINGAVFSGFVLRARPKTKLIDLNFRKYCFMSYSVRKEIIRKSSYTTRALTNGKILSEVFLPLPPLPEQRKIAEILSTWDRAIENTEELIEQKKLLKKGLMQQLLTGKRRLPGFEGEWEEKRMDEICRIIYSNVDKKSSADEIPVRLCNYMDVYYKSYITDNIDYMEATATQKEIEKFRLMKGDIVITKDSETPWDIAKPSYVPHPLTNVICGYHLAILRPFKDISGLFVSFALLHPRIRYKFTRVANGATRFGLNLSDLSRVKISLPNYNESNAISRIFCQIEQDIRYLQNHTRELKIEKHGLLQQLLTGKVRVSI